MVVAVVPCSVGLAFSSGQRSTAFCPNQSQPSTSYGKWMCYSAAQLVHGVPGIIRRQDWCDSCWHAGSRSKSSQKSVLSVWRALADGAASNGASSADSASPDHPIFKSRRDMLLEYVKNVQPEFMERFVKRAPEQVVQGMRQTVTNMLGTLPSQFFEMTVTTVAENLAQLMYSVMMTGYMFRNAQYRLELQQSLAQVALPGPEKQELASGFEPGVQKTKVKGEVLRWHKVDGPVSMDAVEYIELLEGEIQELQRQLEQQTQASHGRNPLLEYLKSLQPQNLQELTSSAGEDALEAMNAFIQRLLGMSDPAQLKRAATETSAAELAKLLYWLMVVGYSIRNIEVRYDMERILGQSAVAHKIAELPPGDSL